MLYYNYLKNNNLLKVDTLYQYGILSSFIQQPSTPHMTQVQRRLANVTQFVNSGGQRQIFNNQPYSPFLLLTSLTIQQKKLGGICRQLSLSFVLSCCNKLTFIKVSNICRNAKIFPINTSKIKSKIIQYLGSLEERWGKIFYRSPFKAVRSHFKIIMVKTKIMVIPTSTLTMGSNNHREQKLAMY